MQSSLGESLPSLAGVAPLRDVLEDLPLPSALPTEAGLKAVGSLALTQDCRQLLSHPPSPAIASQLSNALLSVDLDFLSLREPPPQTVPTTPTKAPPLIHAVSLRCCPVLELQKIVPTASLAPSSQPARAKAQRESRHKRPRLLVSIPRQLLQPQLRAFTVSIPKMKLVSSEPLPLAPPSKKKRRRVYHDPDTQHRVDRFSKLVDSLLVGHSDQPLQPLLAEICSLKQSRLLHKVDPERLMALIRTMDEEVLEGASLVLQEAVPATRRRVSRSCEAALVILHISSAAKVSKTLVVQESIEQAVGMSKHQLENNIYPQFDFVYKMEYKDNAVVPSRKRRGWGVAPHKNIMALYHQLTEIVGLLAVLVETHGLPDSTILQLSDLGIVPFFVEGVNVLQLSALRLMRAVFSRYEQHRELIIEDVFSSLAKLPTSKRSARCFKLSNGGKVSMLTALVLQLVQSIVAPPADWEELQADELGQRLSYNYNLALGFANKFLTKFHKKCCGSKDEEDFRQLFESFVGDLLATLYLPEWPSSEELLSLLGMLLVQSFNERSNEQSMRVSSAEQLGQVAAGLRGGGPEGAAGQVDILAQVLAAQTESPPSPIELTAMDALSENTRHYRKVLIAYLDRQARADPSYCHARDFYISQWVFDTQLKLDSCGREFPEPALQESLELSKSSVISLLSLHSSALEAILDDQTAGIVVRTLTSNRSLSKSFDMYLSSLIRLLSDASVHVRKAGMKALATIAGADPDILSRAEVKRSVEGKLGDPSTLVREAAVEFIGKFILGKPQLTLHYFDMLSERIRDSGVSVRKRVIKILKELCVLQPGFPKFSEACRIILNRLDHHAEEDSTKQLIVGAFKELWFSPTKDPDIISRRVAAITSIVELCPNQDWFDMLLKPMLKSEGAVLLGVCEAMVACLMEKVLLCDEKSSSQELLSTVRTLHLFSGLFPQLLLPHISTLHTYIAGEANVSHFIVLMLREAVPLMERPTSKFLASLEADLVKLLMNAGQMLITSSASCLGAIVSRVTHNYHLVDDCYQRFTRFLDQMRLIYSKREEDPLIKTKRPQLLRSLFSLGVLCKYFDIEAMPQREGVTRPSPEAVFSNLFFFICHGDETLQVRTVQGLGLFCVRHPEMMLRSQTRALYSEWLSGDSGPKCQQVLTNISSYLKEVEGALAGGEGETRDLLTMGDQHSSVSSGIAQAFLQPILDSLLNRDPSVREGALKVVLLITSQGLVQPNQCVPYLLAASTDPGHKAQAEHQLTDHASKHGHLSQTQLQLGVRKSYELQGTLTGEAPRGFSLEAGAMVSLLAHTYTILRSKKTERRAFLKTSLLKPFEDYERAAVGYLLYLADLLAHLPYNTVEEPLFVIHHIELIVSLAGSNLIQLFREALSNQPQEDLVQGRLVELCRLCQGPMLLLHLKSHLKKLYGLTDSKCQKYSPSESNKAYEKALSRRSVSEFSPGQAVLDQAAGEFQGEPPPLKSLDYYLNQYYEFRDLMNQLDPFEEQGSEDELPRDCPSRPASVSSRGSSSSGKSRRNSVSEGRRKRRKRVLSSDDSD